VIFRAVDRECGRDVVLRRFFPRGRDQGGLDAGEQEQFRVTVGKLKEVEHKCLRKVIDGGCDPVDGMPFLVTEWIEGTSVAEFLGGKTLEATSVKGLIDVALETSAELSRVLGKEDLWVGCGPDDLVVPETGRGISFWVTPFRPKGGPGLLPLAELAERMLQWQGRPQPEWAGEGMAGWIQSVRSNPSGWSLGEATEALHRPVEASPTGQVRRAPGVGSRSVLVTKMAKRETRVWPWVAASLALVILAGAFGVWKAGGIDGLKRRIKGPEAEQVDRRAKMLEELRPKAPAPTSTPVWNPDANPSSPPVQSAAPSPDNPANMLQGKVADATKSKGDKSRYLKISVDGQTRWVGYRVASGVPGLEMADFKSLVGKNVRVTGEFRNEGGSRGNVLMIKKRDQIVELKP